MVDLGDIFELQLLIECDLELRLQVMRAKVELDLRVLVADKLLVIVDDCVCEGGVEGVLEDGLSLGIGRLAVEVDEEAIGRAGNPCAVSVNMHVIVVMLDSNILTLVEIHCGRLW